MRISDGSSDVCSSDLPCFGGLIGAALVAFGLNALFAAVWEFSFQRFPKPAIEIIGETCYSPGMGSSVPHDFAVSIEPADIEFKGHEKNARYLKWVQAAVISL